MQVKNIAPTSERYEEEFKTVVNYLYDKYDRYMVALEKESPLSKIRPINDNDIFSLGTMLYQFEDYYKYLSDAGNVGDLGKVPEVALDVITASYGSSIIPVLCSVQPIDEQKGFVWYKTIEAATTKGGVSAGDTIMDTRTGPANVQYATEQNTVTLGTTSTGTLSYSGADLGNAPVPIRPGSVRVTVADLGLTAQDNGTGYAFGPGIQVTINYETGAWQVDLLNDPGGSHNIIMTYGILFEETDTPKAVIKYVADEIVANIFDLTADIGVFESYAMKKRFGVTMDDEVAKDLTDEIVLEIGNAIIANLAANVPANAVITWDDTPTQYVSWAEHRLELKKKISEAESKITANAGRGVVNCIIAGVDALANLSNLPGFERKNISGVGPQVYGTLDGIPVIRAQVGVGSNEFICYYKGNGRFDAAAVYAPYMPLFVKNVGVVTHPLRQTSVAAVWAGIKTVLPNYLAKVSIS